MSWRRIAACGGSATALLAYACVAHAQAGAASMTPASPDATPTVAEVVVTATRRETTLERTPIAISAFNQKQLDRQQVANVTDIQRFVPSLQFNQNAANNALLLTLRGIGNDAAFTIASDPEVGFYVDGIYSPTVQGSTGLLYDLERLEVLRGPQGTLFGRNTTAGAITLTTAKAKLGAQSGYLELIGGDYGRFGSRGAINIPLSPTLAARFSFATEQHDGYVSYQRPPALPGVDAGAFTTGGARYDSQEQQSARASFLWKPDSKFTWNIDFEGFLDEGTPDVPLLQAPRASQDIYSILADTAPRKYGSNVSIRSTMDYSINDYLGATYIAGYSRDYSTDVTESDAGALPVIDATGALTPFAAEAIRDRKKSSYISQEVQLKSQGHHFLEWIVGGIYSHEEAKARQDIDDRDGYVGGPPGFGISFDAPSYRVNSYAGYGQATLNLSDRLRITGGLRYSRDSKSSPGQATALFTGCSSAPTAPAVCRGFEGQFFNVTDGAQIAALLGPSFSSSPDNIVPRDFSKVTYLGRLEYDLYPGILVYGGVSTGFKSGIINSVGPITGPETLTDYEGGAKLQLFNRRMNLNLVGYYYDYKGFQVSEIVVERDAAGNLVGSTLQNLNAQGATAYGFEAEATGSFTALDHVQGSLAVQHTRLGSLITLDQRFDFDPTIVADQQQLRGNALPHAPTFSATLTYEHDFLLPNGGKITPRGTVHYETSSWLTIFNGDRKAPAVNNGVGTDFDQQKAYTRSDLAIRYTPPDDRYEFELFIKNVENTAVRTGAQNYNNGSLASQDIFLSFLQPPRTVGARVRLTF